MSQRTLVVLLLVGFPVLATAQSTTFNVTGALQTYMVPAGATQVMIEAVGAAGGAGNDDTSPTTPGNGARLIANFAVTSGETLNVVVGQMGQNNSVFGGGGGGSSDGGGGGGGYNGGGGGDGDSSGGGGGGGSYSASVTTLQMSGFMTSDGNGYVIITVIAVTPSDAYQLTYASNLGTTDSFVNVTNSGATDPPGASGSICANVYVFDPNEEELDCRSCLITPNALQSMSVLKLLSNNLTPEKPTSAIIALLASAPSTSGTCDPSAVTTATLVPGMRAWSTNVHSSSAPSSITYGTELPFSRSKLSAGEFNQLTGLCSFIRANGSGSGQCTGCTTGGQ